MPTDKAMREAKIIIDAWPDRENFLVNNVADLIDEKDAEIFKLAEINKKSTDEYEKQIVDLQAELERVRRFTHCAYCEQEFPLDTATADQVGEHIHNCPKHPIAVYKERIKELEEGKEGYVTMTVSEFNAAQRAKAEIEDLKVEAADWHRLQAQALKITEHHVLEKKCVARIKELEAELKKSEDRYAKDAETFCESQNELTEARDQITDLEAKVSQWENATTPTSDELKDPSMERMENLLRESEKALKEMYKWRLEPYEIEEIRDRIRAEFKRKGYPWE